MASPRKLKPKEVIAQGLPKGRGVRHLLLQQPHGLKEYAAPYPTFQMPREKTGLNMCPVGTPVHPTPSPFTQLPVTVSVLEDSQPRDT